jgi:hypothetical protein
MFFLRNEIRVTVLRPNELRLNLRIKFELREVSHAVVYLSGAS